MHLFFRSMPALQSLCTAIGIGDVPTADEQALWEKAPGQRAGDGLRAYLQAYPTGAYADEARSRLAACSHVRIETLGPEKQVRYDKESLVLHEAVPGHIFQGSLARSQEGLPEFRKFYGNSAYAEGWALYAESLGSQLGLYRDPYSRFGQLASERFRAARLVIDTGIHALGWTREQALDYLRAHAPTQALSEVYRYISWPGQALAYKLGQLTILKLRSEAESTLGPRFDERAFHDRILGMGAVPLKVLEEQMRAYEARFPGQVPRPPHVESIGNPAQLAALKSVVPSGTCAVVLLGR
jgi:uncharacterized protein (DUF885 family)